MKKKKKLDTSFGIALGIILLTIALPLFLILISHRQQIMQFAAGTSVQVTVDPSASGISIPSDFMGISSEPASTPCQQIALEASNPTLLENLFKNLGQGTLRVGGDAVEGATWGTSGNGTCDWSGTTQTPAMVDSLAQLLKKINWKLIWGVNLKNGDPANDAQNAAYVAKSVGSNLIGIEIGNEPNLYGWDYATYQTKWEAVASAIQAAGNIPIVGPAGTDCCTDFFTPFISAEGSKIVMATDHYYPTADSTDFQTLLSQNTMQSSIQSLQARMQSAKAKNLPYQLGETNSVANVPPANIGNAFGQSLWVLDYAMNLLQMGASGMNVHGWNGDNTSILYPDNTPRPNYFGMLAFHYTAPNGTLLPVQINAGGVNMTAYAVKTTSGDLNVLLINKDLTQSADAQINTTQSFSQASDIRLSAASVDATTGITLGGSGLAADGSWKPQTVEPITPSGSNSTVSVPAASAVIITYKNGTGGGGNTSSGATPTQIIPTPSYVCGGSTNSICPTDTPATSLAPSQAVPSQTDSNPSVNPSEISLNPSTLPISGGGHLHGNKNLIQLFLAFIEFLFALILQFLHIK